MRKLFYLLVLATLLSCTGRQESTDKTPEQPIIPSEVSLVQWAPIDSIDIKEFNSGLEAGKLTMDLAIYFPSNFDTAFKKVTLAHIMEGIQAAKDIYAPTDVQLNLLWVRSGEVEPRFFSVQANEVPGVPRTEYANMYQHMRRHPSILTREMEMAFQSIIEPDPDNHRTIYIVVLQDVFLPYMEVSEGRNWMIKSVRTGGLSFPPYSYSGSIPAQFRGIFTVSNTERVDRLRKTIAHEIGHKVINVGHEYKKIDPQNEVFAEGGLMVYGDGEEILSGEEGRWHVERLHLSPFLYRMNEDGIKEWNPDFQEGGHYYDPIYGDKVVAFKGTSGIPEDW